MNSNQKTSKMKIITTRATKSVTMAKISKEAGISQGAISSLLNGRDYGIRVNPETRDRVFAVCRKMGYIPNDLRALIRMYPLQGALCLLVSDDTQPLHNTFARRIEQNFLTKSKPACSSITHALYSPDADYTAHPELLPHCLQFGIASKIICIGTPNLSLVSTLLERELPVAILGTSIDFPNAINLSPDYNEAAFIGLQYLHELGHRKMAVIGGPDGANDPAVVGLSHGLQQAQTRLQLSPESLVFTHQTLDFENAMSAISTIATWEPRPTAIICLGDDTTSGIIAGASAKGIRIPEELSVLSFGSSELSRRIHPSPTTVHLPIEEIGEHAIQKIDRFFEETTANGTASGELPGGGDTELFSAHLIERGTCSIVSAAN